MLLFSNSFSLYYKDPQERLLAHLVLSLSSGMRILVLHPLEEAFTSVYVPKVPSTLSGGYWRSPPGDELILDLSVRQAVVINPWRKFSGALLVVVAWGDELKGGKALHRAGKAAVFMLQVLSVPAIDQRALE